MPPALANCSYRPLTPSVPRALSIHLYTRKEQKEMDFKNI